MSLKTKKTAKKSDKTSTATKCTLLDTARKLFALKGLSGTSTREIAAESQINISMISYHFGGKEGLYKEVIEDYARNVTSEVNPFLESISTEKMTRESFTEDLKRFIEYLIQSRIDYPEISTIFERERLDQFKISAEVSDRLFYPIIKKLSDIINAAKKKKIVRENVDPELFFLILLQGVQGVFSFFACESQFANKISKKYEKDCEKLRDQVVQIYLEGLLEKK